jgi:alanine racemase
LYPDRALRPSRPAWAEIDLDAIAHNVRTLGRAAAPARLMPVVKANAYGHGAVPVARVALEAGADALAVVCVDEAEELRRAGIVAPILVLTYTPIEDAERAVALDITLTVTSRRLAVALSSFATAAGKTVRVHLKVDTGLHRFGVRPDEAVALAQTIRYLPSLELEGIFTHFIDGANAPGSADQYERLARVTAEVDWIRDRHAANSGGIITTPLSHGDFVRPGILLYGCYPDASLLNRLDLRPALSLKARLGRIHDVEAGETVGYSGAWRASKRTRIGLVMIGYADGYQRVLSNRGVMLVRGRRAPVVGRVSMDVTTVDLTDIPEAEVDDEVVVIGRQGLNEITADDLADTAGTINHEVFTGLPARLPRLYLRDGRPVGLRTLNDTTEAVLETR